MVGVFRLPFAFGTVHLEVFGQCHAGGVLMHLRYWVVVWLGLLFSAHAGAAEGALVGTIGSRAILIVDGGRPQTIAVGGSTVEGVRLLSLNGDVARVALEGVQEVLRLGESVVHQAPSERNALRLSADDKGHFWVSARINGASAQRCVIDTGATLVSIGKGVALQAGINYLKGAPGTSLTANGPVQVWRVRIDSLDLGGIVVHNVEAAVHDGDLPVVLLGMSLLNRLQWSRDGNALVLSKRF